MGKGWGELVFQGPEFDGVASGGEDITGVLGPDATLALREELGIKDSSAGSSVLDAALLAEELGLPGEVPSQISERNGQIRGH